MTISATVKWTDTLQFVGRAGESPAVVMDSSDGGSGPSPMQMVLLGVAGCTAIDVVLIMQKKRTRLHDFQVRITGEQAESDPQRFTRVHIEYLLAGEDIKPKAVEQAIRLSEEQFCSAMASLNAEFSHSYRILNDMAEAE